MRGTTPIRFLLTFMVFLGFLGFLSTLPGAPKIIEPFDFAWFVGGMIGVTGSCVVFSGVPCAAAIAIYGIVSMYQYIIVSQDWLKLLIFTPLIVVLIYLIMRLARGGG